MKRKLTLRKVENKISSPQWDIRKDAISKYIQTYYQRHGMKMLPPLATTTKIGQNTY
jgi:hypothetical protein